MLWYLSNIVWYQSKYWNYTSKKQFGQLPYSPSPSAQWITFLLFISQKFLLNIKDVECDFRMCCILVLFLFLWIINFQFTNFGFLNFLFSNIAMLACFDPKLPFLSLKLLLNFFYIENMDEITLTEAGWGWKVQNFPFCYFW